MKKKLIFIFFSSALLLLVNFWLLISVSEHLMSFGDFSNFLNLVLLVFLIATFDVFFESPFESPKVETHSFIDNYTLPPLVLKKFKVHYPGLTEVQVQQVITALKIYFHCCVGASTGFTPMPSKCVDTLWHEFILTTPEYRKFGEYAFGHYFDHIRAEMLLPNPVDSIIRSNTIESGLKDLWLFSCRWEEMDLLTPVKLPLLFAIDAEFAIADGFSYDLETCSENWRYVPPIAQQGSDSGGGGCGGGCGG